MTQKYQTEDKGLLDVCAVKRVSLKKSDLHTTVSQHQFSNHESNEKDKSGGIYHIIPWLMNDYLMKSKLKKKLEILPLHVIP